MTSATASTPATDPATVARIFHDHDSFVLASHIRPDGDAIGSCLGLAHALRQAGKKVVVLNEDGCPSNLDFLPGAGDVIQSSAAPDVIEAEVAIALDTASRERLGKSTLSLLESQPRLWVNIDHHVSNPGYGDVALVDSSAPATGQIVFELLEIAGLEAPLEALESLYVAISTDTGSFQYPNTTSRTFAIASEMVERGLDVGRISALTYHRRPLRKVRLLQHLFQRLQLDVNDRVASWDLDLATKEKLSLLPDDSEDLIDQIRSIDSVIVAVFFEELPGGAVRVSSRSKNPAIDVCRICARFGGGGHPLAAGARIPGPLEQARESFLQAIHEAVAELPQT